MTDVSVKGGVDFSAYLKDFAATFEASGRGAFSDGLGGDEYVLWSGDDTTIPVSGGQAFIIDSGGDGDLVYDFATHTVGGTIDSITFGVGVTQVEGDFSTQASVTIDDLDLASTGGDGVINQLITDLMAGNTDVLLGILKEQDLDFTGSKGDDAFRSFAGADDLDGGKGNDILKAGGGDDELIGGKGDDILAGQKGNDLFEFEGRKFGHDTVADFGVGRRDVISFDDGVFSSFKQVMASAEQQGDDVVIGIGRHASVTLEDVSLADLNRGDFLFD